MAESRPGFKEILCCDTGKCKLCWLLWEQENLRELEVVPVSRSLGKKVPFQLMKPESCLLSPKKHYNAEALIIPSEESLSWETLLSLFLSWLEEGRGNCCKASQDWGVAEHMASFAARLWGERE